MMTPQIEEFVFSHADFPREFDIQLWAFVRLVWGENLSGEDRFRTRSWDDPSPTHFVRAAGDLLVSHVLVFPLSIEGHRGVLRVGASGRCSPSRSSVTRVMRASSCAGLRSTFARRRMSE